MIADKNEGKIDDGSLGRLGEVRSNGTGTKRQWGEPSKRGAVRPWDRAMEGLQSPQKLVSEPEHTERKDSNG